MATTTFAIGHLVLSVLPDVLPTALKILNFFF